MNISIVVPVYNGGASFRKCLSSIQAANPAPYEVVVVADGDTDGSRELARNFGYRVIENETPTGPARARNQGARAANGDIIFFVDADVTLQPDALGRVAAVFEKEPHIAALIGSYDDKPPGNGFFAQYKNLQHHFVHQQGNEEASTFWGACGAIRRDVFMQLGGFDEAYRRPSIEDIELGYRLKRAGHHIRLVKHLQIKHLKEWTMSSQLRADFFDRALPWTRLLARDGQFINDLNLDLSSRLSVVLAYVFTGMLALSIFELRVLWVALLAIAGLLVLNAPLYAFFLRTRGLWFALRATLWHWVYYLYSGLAFAIGTIQFRLFNHPVAS
jgi:glycosyltransferase involved in cell wall biosynthesis